MQTVKETSGMLDSLPCCVSAWDQHGICPLVDLALSSMALAVFSQTHKHPPAAMEASSQYNRLLRVAQERIVRVKTPGFENKDFDASLLAILLMGRYESAIHRATEVDLKDSFTSLHSWSHHDGALAVLKVWKDDPNYRPTTLIIKQTRRGLIRSFLLRNLLLPDWIMDGSRFGEQNLELDFDRIFTRTVNLHHEVVSSQKKCILRFSKLERLHNVARELEGMLEDWASTRFSGSRTYQRHILAKLEPLQKEHFYSSEVYSYSGLEYATIWSQYFTLKMLLYSTLFRMLESNIQRESDGVDLTLELSDCLAELRNMANSLASTIPFFLERFETEYDPKSLVHHNSVRLKSQEVKPHLACLAVWPLSVASSLKGVDATQQVWFRTELATLGRVSGIGILQHAETDSWPTL